MARSGSGISAIFASTALSPSALSAREPRRPAAFSSLARSFIAARSSSVNPSYVLAVAPVLLAAFMAGFLLRVSMQMNLMLKTRRDGGFSEPDSVILGPAAGMDQLPAAGAGERYQDSRPCAGLQAGGEGRRA